MALDILIGTSHLSRNFTVFARNESRFLVWHGLVTYFIWHMERTDDSKSSRGPNARVCIIHCARHCCVGAPVVFYSVTEVWRRLLQTLPPIVLHALLPQDCPHILTPHSLTGGAPACKLEACPRFMNTASRKHGWQRTQMGRSRTGDVSVSSLDVWTRYLHAAQEKRSGRR